jgi:hypothetical protein
MLNFINELLAFFVAAVLLADAEQPGTWPRTLQARVFTLDATTNGLATIPATGAVFEWTRELVQQNHDMVIPAETNAFLLSLESIFQTTGQATRNP